MNSTTLEHHSLTNALADAAERAGVAWRASKEAESRSIAKALEAGRVLVDAREEAQHGTWGLFLARAGISERQAQRLMQLARSGLRPDTVSDLGGMKAALTYISARKLPDAGGALLVNIGCDETVALIWSDPAHPGYFHCAAADLTTEAPSFVEMTRRPLRGEPLRLDDGAFFHPVWHTLELQTGNCPADLRFSTVEGDEASWWLGLFADPKNEDFPTERKTNV